MCPRSGVSRQRSHPSAEQLRAMAWSWPSSAFSSAAAPYHVEPVRQLHSWRQPLGLERHSQAESPAFINPAQARAMWTKTHLNAALRRGGDSKRHSLLVPQPGRDNAPSLQPGVQPRREGRAFLPLLATAVTPPPSLHSRAGFPGPSHTRQRNHRGVKPLGKDQRNASSHRRHFVELF